jgi:hypothetical protein
MHRIRQADFVGEHLLPVFTPPLSHAGYFELCSCDSQPDDQDSTPWLGVLSPFYAADTLCVYMNHLNELQVPTIIRVLGDLTEERAAEVMPLLGLIVLGPLKVEPWVTPVIGRFVDMRELSDHPVRLLWWDDDDDF